MTDSSNSHIEPYWPLEEQPFFKEACKALTQHDANNLQRAIAEDWASQFYTVDLTDNIKLRVSYQKETSNQPSADGIISGRRRRLDIAWWRGDENRKATISMIANDRCRFDSFGIHLVGEIPLSIRQALIGQRLERLVELPEQISLMGRYVIVDWANDKLLNRQTAHLRLSLNAKKPVPTDINAHIRQRIN